MESEKRGETDQDDREYDKSIFPNSQIRGFLINKLILRNNTSTNCKNPSGSLGADNLLAEKQRISAYKRIKHHIYNW